MLDWTAIKKQRLSISCMRWTAKLTRTDADGHPPNNANPPMSLATVFVRKVQMDTQELDDGAEEGGLQASAFYSHTFPGNGGHES